MHPLDVIVEEIEVDALGKEISKTYRILVHEPPSKHSNKYRGVDKQLMASYAEEIKEIVRRREERWRYETSIREEQVGSDDR